MASAHTEKPLTGCTPPRQCDPWLNSQMQKQWDDLRTINTFLNPTGNLPCEDVWKCISLLSGRTEFIQRIKLWEAKTTPVDWKRLDEWIEKADNTFQRELDQHRDMMNALGIDASDMEINKDMNIDTIQEKIEASPMMKILRRTYGPNWVRIREKAHGLSCDSLAGSHCIPMDIFRPSVLKLTGAITRHWETLRSMKSEGKLDRFRGKWARLTPSIRSVWLQQQHPELPSCPHTDIYEWAHSSELNRHGLDQEIFLKSLLDIEDLSRDDVLPCLLEARATTHPWFFRSIDGRSVYLGLWCGSLKQLKVQGRISFRSEASPEEPYGILFHGDTNRYDLPSDPYEVSPSLGLHQLRAQLRTYEFLCSCLGELLNYYGSNKEVEPSYNHTDTNDCLPLLTRSLRLDYYDRSKTINLEYLDSLLKASLLEAQDDLWQLRKDPELWAKRLKETRGTSPERMSNLLRAVFGRIDTFHTLSRHIDSLKDHDWCGHSTTSSLPADALRRLTSLDTALLSMLDEELGRLQTIKWSAEKCTSTTFSRLFEMAKTNDPTLRVIGLPKVMRIMDREILKDGTQELIPFTVMQALSNVSVLAVCQGESFKHWDFVPHAIHHTVLANHLKDEWDKREHLWMSSLDRALDAMGESEIHRVNIHIHNKGIELHSRHRTFWYIVDKYMKESSQDSNIGAVNEIQQKAPILSIAPSAEFAPTRAYAMPATIPTITRTRLLRSNGRKPRPSPAISPTNNRELWTALLAPIYDIGPTTATIFKVKHTTAKVFSALFSKSESRGSITWAAFTSAMTELRFSVMPRFGSVSTFYPPQDLGVHKSITLHRPHNGQVEGRVLLIFASRLKKSYGWGEQSFEIE